MKRERKEEQSFYERRDIVEEVRGGWYEDGDGKRGCFSVGRRRREKEKRDEKGGKGERVVESGKGKESEFVGINEWRGIYFGSPSPALTQAIGVDNFAFNIILNNEINVQEAGKLGNWETITQPLLLSHTYILPPKFTHLISIPTIFYLLHVFFLLETTLLKTLFKTKYRHIFYQKFKY